MPSILYPGVSGSRVPHPAFLLSDLCIPVYLMLYYAKLLLVSLEIRSWQVGENMNRIVLDFRIRFLANCGCDRGNYQRATGGRIGKKGSRGGRK